jgi:hypothetical protein
MNDIKEHHSCKPSDSTQSHCVVPEDETCWNMSGKPVKQNTGIAYRMYIGSDSLIKCNYSSEYVTFFSNIFNLCPPFRVRNHVSQP